MNTHVFLLFSIYFSQGHLSLIFFLEGPGSPAYSLTPAASPSRGSPDKQPKFLLPENVEEVVDEPLPLPPDGIVTIRHILTRMARIQSTKAGLMKVRLGKNGEECNVLDVDRSCSQLSYISSSPFFPLYLFIYALALI